MKKERLNALTKEQIETGRVPVRELLENSAYYPACHFDGGVIKDCNTRRQELGVVSFVYCDYNVKRHELMSNLNMLGYRVFAQRKLTISDLGGYPIISHLITLSHGEMERMKWNVEAFANKHPFAQWIVFERTESYTEEHGPERVSLVYICGDGVATYLSLYAANRIAPRMLAIIQPGHGFGFNWTNFFCQTAPLHRALMANEAGMPEYVYFGGIGDGYAEYVWPEYTLVDTINHYYRLNDGEAVLSKRKVS